MIRVGIAEDDLLVRKGLAMLVDNFTGIEVAFEAENGIQLLEQVTVRAVDVVLLDLQMPKMDGLECCSIRRIRHPEIKVLFITHSSTSESIRNVINCGAHGFYSKNSKLFELETAIQNVKHKDFYFSTDLGVIIREVLSGGIANVSYRRHDCELSNREVEIIRLACMQYSNTEIGDILNINVRTVETHRQRIMVKTKSKNFIGVILHAIKQNLISVNDL